jgi:hypothetical protein
MVLSHKNIDNSVNLIKNILYIIKKEPEMPDIDNLLREAEKLGIVNIDVAGDQLSSEIIQTAIDATKQLNSKLNKDLISRKLQKADGFVAVPNS